MSYVKYEYSRVNWKNGTEELTTPLGKTNLNMMDYAIEQVTKNLDESHTELNTLKFDKTDAMKVFSRAPKWDESTGVLHFAFYDGTEMDINFNVGKIPVTFSMSADGIITMITADGETWTCNIFDALPTFADSDRIRCVKESDETGAVITKFDLVKGTITDEYLEPQYLAKLMEQVGKAESSVFIARQYEEDSDFNAKLSQSYAIGGSYVRDGEDTDNSKYYSERSAEYMNAAKQSEEACSNIISDVGEKVKNIVFSLDDNGNLNWEVEQDA